MWYLINYAQIDYKKVYFFKLFKLTKIYYSASDLLGLTITPRNWKNINYYLPHQSLVQLISRKFLLRFSDYTILKYHKFWMFSG